MILRPFILTISLIMICSFMSLAQPGGDPGGGGNPTVPISGIEILLGVGGLYGARKFLQKKK